MKYIDQHVHSKISHDGISTMNEYINNAEKYNVHEITFTEHFDDYKGIDTNLKTLDINHYKNKYLEANNKIKTNFGIEIGLRNESYELINSIVENNKFDFIIGSSHIVDGKDTAYDKSFFEGLTHYQVIINYLNDVLNNIKLYKTQFDVYGHLDYVIRYIIKYYGSIIKKIDYEDFKDLIDEILLCIIKSDKGIEINTSGIRYGLDCCHPNIDIIKRYNELGGKIITIGSDAHKIQDLASNFDIVYDILESFNIENIAIYHNRIPEFVKIKSLK